MVSALDSGTNGRVRAQAELKRCVLRQGDFNAWANPVMNQDPIQGEKDYSQLLNARETGIGIGGRDHLARLSHLPDDNNQKRFERFYKQIRYG